MPAVTCIRCFAVFQSEDVRPGVAPVCSRCSPALASAPSLRAADGGGEGVPSRRLLPRRAVIVVALLVAAAAAGVAVAFAAGLLGTPRP